jgi:hypothetical protein
VLMAQALPDRGSPESPAGTRHGPQTISLRSTRPEILDTATSRPVHVAFVQRRQSYAHAA